MRTSRFFNCPGPCGENDFAGSFSPAARLETCAPAPAFVPARLEPCAPAPAFVPARLEPCASAPPFAPAPSESPARSPVPDNPLTETEDLLRELSGLPLRQRNGSAAALSLDTPVGDLIRFGWLTPEIMRRLRRQMEIILRTPCDRLPLRSLPLCALPWILYEVERRMGQPGPSPCGS